MAIKTTTPKADFIWFDGDILPWEEANVHLLTHTLHYGLGVFEGTRLYELSAGGSAVFRLDDHLKRLATSAKILQIEIPYTLNDLKKATHMLLAKNGFNSCYLRHIAFMGAGAMGIYAVNNPIRTAIIAWPWGTYLGDDALNQGIRCKISSYVRHFPNAMMNKAKACGGYINSILAKREAISQDFDEAIMLDTQGFVAEGSGENIFVIRGNKVRTPPLTSALEGITRDSIITILADLGYNVQEQYMSRDDLYLADEIFLTGTAAEITPVREVDQRVVGMGKPGPLTQKVQEIFFQTVRGEQQRYRHWLSELAVARA